MTELKKIASTNIALALEPFRPNMPSHLNFELFVDCAAQLVADKKELRECPAESLNEEFKKCFLAGLMPDNKEAYIGKISRNIGTSQNKNYQAFAQYQPMISGVIKLVNLRPDVKSFTAKVLYENDFFEYSIDENGEHIKYVAARGKHGPLDGAFATLRKVDGELLIEYMNLDDITAVKSKSKTSKFGPWVDFPGQMACKSVSHRLFKKYGVSSEITEMLEIATNMDFDKSEEVQSIIEFYPKDKFTANFGSWAKFIQAGKKDADTMIKFIESKGLPLSDDQKDQLKAIKVC